MFSPFFFVKELVSFFSNFHCFVFIFVKKEKKGKKDIKEMQKKI